jgi:hypothetical protein
MQHSTGFGVGYDPVTWQCWISAPIAAFLLIFAVLFLAGLIFGRLLLRRKVLATMAERLKNVDTAFRWRRHETTVTLTYWLLLMGFSLFVAGVTGTIEFEVKNARVVTSLPGLVIIYLGYRLWRESSSRESTLHD